MSEIFIIPEKSDFSKPQKAYTIAFHTLGCKVNRYETDAVRQAFEKNGFVVLPDSEPVDVFVINTCTVTAEADRKSRQMIRRAKRKNPNAVVVAMGCQVELLTSASEADVSVGTGNRLSIVDMVLEKMGCKSSDFSGILPHKNEFLEEADICKSKYQEFGSVLSQEETRAYIKIEDGCDSFCSYCIIPFARGRVVSRDAQDIIREAKELGDRGFHEIVLTGIHICSYGKDKGEGISSLARLLADLDKIPSIHRIRLGSLEPNSMTEEFIRSISGLSKICPHFHISLQSGSDSVLSRMNRKYDTKIYRSVLSKFRRYFADFAVTTDIIVAFPAETQKEHEDSLLFCREMGFSHIHVFPFSARSKTKAAAMLPKVSAETAEQRRDEFLSLSKELADTYLLSFVGRTAEVLLETRDKNNCCTGYTRQYFKVHIDPHEDLSQGLEVKVHIYSHADGELFGRIISESKV